MIVTDSDSDAILEAFKHDNVVLVFGAGVSTSLAGRSMSWKSWLRYGISLLNSPEDLSLRLDSANSTEQLIAIAGDLIDESRSEGVYDFWMTSFIHDAIPTESRMIDAIRLLSETGYHFLTTNYDTLLEAVTGRKTLSYVDKSLTYSELKLPRSGCVIHIHGLYNNGIDDIIATKEDYNNIIYDKGAQFVQNIASTKTLVFVGCGGTMEDDNICRMVTFAHDELQLDSQYFYLFCGGTSPELPEYVNMVRYGDNYECLPSFLRLLAETRLKSIAETHPIIRLCASSLNRRSEMDYAFYGSNVGFYGRSRELAVLEMFIDDPAKFRWMAITGQAGMGKSRLAYEAMLRFNCRCFPFFIRTDVDEDVVFSFDPVMDSLVFYDYVLGSEEMIARSVISLSRRFRENGYKLRVVFLERADTTLPGSWYWNLTQKMTQEEKSDFQRCEYCLYSERNGRDGARFLRLDDLDSDSVLKLIGNVIETMGLEYDETVCSNLMNEYALKSERNAFRPLFVRIYVESRIYSGLNAKCTFTDDDELLVEYILREQKKWKSGLDDDNNLLRRLVRLILRSSVSGALDLDDLPELYSGDWSELKKFLDAKAVFGEERISLRMCFQSEWGQSVELQKNILASNYPDIIKERMFSYYFDGDDNWEDVCDEMWENDREQFVTFIRRCISDFPDSTFFGDVVMRYGGDMNDVDSLRMRLARIENLTSSLYLSTEKDFEMLEIEYRFWKRVKWDGAGSDLNRIHIEAISMIAGAYLNLAQIGMMKNCLHAFTNIPRDYDDELRIAFDYIAYQADVDCLFEKGDTLINMEKRLESKTHDYYLKRKMGLVILKHACIRCCVNRNWNKFDELLKRLKKDIDELDEDETELVMESYYYAELISKKIGALSLFSEMDSWSSDKKLSDRSFFYLYSVFVFHLQDKLQISYSEECSEVSGELIRCHIKNIIMENKDSIQEVGPHSSAVKITVLSLVLGANPDEDDVAVCTSLVDGITAKYPYSDEVLAAYISMLRDYHVLYKDEIVPTKTVDLALSIALRCPESPYVQKQYLALVRESVEQGNIFYEENKVLNTARAKNNMIHVELETTREGVNFLDDLILWSFGGPF